MRRKLAREFEEIVEGLVQGAKRGSCAHVKLVTELLELRGAKPEKSQRKSQGPWTELLREMERKEAEEKKELADRG